MTEFATGWGGLVVVLAAIAVAVGLDWARQGIAGSDGRGAKGLTVLAKGTRRSARWAMRIGTVLALVLAALGAALTLMRFAELAFT